MTHFKVVESISRSFGLLGFCLRVGGEKEKKRVRVRVKVFHHEIINKK